MKVGEKVPVQIGQHVVAQATVKELGDGTATLVVPATLVVMGTRTTLDDLPTQETGDVETLITGVDRASGEPVESAVGNEPSVNNDTPTGAIAAAPVVPEPVEPPAEVPPTEPAPAEVPEPPAPVVNTPKAVEGAVE